VRERAITCSTHSPASSQSYAIGQDIALANFAQADAIIVRVVRREVRRGKPGERTELERRACTPSGDRLHPTSTGEDEAASRPAADVRAPLRFLAAGAGASSSWAGSTSSNIKGVVLLSPIEPVVVLQGESPAGRATVHEPGWDAVAYPTLRDAPDDIASGRIGSGRRATRKLAADLPPTARRPMAGERRETNKG
jgi:hypothetical protein